MDCSVDKELAGWPHLKSCSQWLIIQVETSNEWCQGYVFRCDGLISSLVTWTVGLTVPSEVWRWHQAEWCSWYSIEGRDSIQRDLLGLERWACANLMKFNKTNCKVMHLIQGNLKHQYSLENEWIERSLAEKDLGYWVVKKSTWASNLHLQSQKATISWATSKEAWPAGEGRWLSHLRPCVENSTALGPWTCWSGSREGPQKFLKNWSTYPLKRGYENWSCSAWRREDSGENLMWLSNI